MRNWWDSVKKVKLLDVCNVYQPKTVATKYFVENGPYVVYGANGPIGRYSEYNHEESEVLMACRGATCGAINVSESYSWINGNAMVIKPNGSFDLDKKYLKYYLMYAPKDSIITGTAQPQITRQNLKHFIISICDISEQQRIVARIEELFSQIDDAEATLQKTKAQLALYKQAVLSEAFSDIINMNQCHLDDLIIRIESGKSIRCEERPPEEDECGIVKVSAVTWGEFDEEESKTCKPDQFIENRRIMPGDLLISKANTIQLVGNCVIVKSVNKNLMLSDKILRLVLKKDILPKFVLYFLRCPAGRRQIQSFSTGNQESMRNISQQNLRRIVIPVIDEAKQKAIVEYIEERISVCEAINRTIETANNMICSLRQSILKKAFGEDEE